MNTLGVYPLGDDSFLTTEGVRFLPSAIGSAVDPIFMVEFETVSGELLSNGSLPVLGTYPMGAPANTLVEDIQSHIASDADYTTGPLDTPANTHYEPRLLPISIDEGVPLDPSADRRANVTLAQIALINADGIFDEVSVSRGVDRRPVKIKLLMSRQDKFSEALTIWNGYGVSMQSNEAELQLMATDITYLTDSMLLGTYSGLGGAYGVADLKDQVVPQVYGFVRNMKPVRVNPTLEIYQFHDRLASSVEEVRVRGAVINFNAAYATYEALAAATIPNGTHAVALTSTGSYFRLGSQADGVVTCTVKGDAFGGYVETVPGMMRRLLERVLASENIFAASFADIATAYPGRAGIALLQQQTASAAVSQLAKSCYLWWGDNGIGQVTVGEITQPYLNEGTLIDQNYLRGLPALASLPESVSPCLWRAQVSYRPNWNVFSESDVASVVLQDAAWSWLSSPYLRVGEQDAARLLRHQSAKNYGADEPHTTLFDDEVSARAVATRLMSLFAPGNHLWRIPVNQAGWGIRRGDTINVEAGIAPFRYGRPLVVVGRQPRGADVDLLAFG